jgi:hypothetical protein
VSSKVKGLKGFKEEGWGLTVSLWGDHKERNPLAWTIRWPRDFQRHIFRVLVTETRL